MSCAHELSGMGDNHGKRDPIFIYNQSQNDKIKTIERKIERESLLMNYALWLHTGSNQEHETGYARNIQNSEGY